MPPAEVKNIPATRGDVLFHLNKLDPFEAFCFTHCLMPGVHRPKEPMLFSQLHNTYSYVILPTPNVATLLGCVDWLNSYDIRWGSRENINTYDLPPGVSKRSWLLENFYNSIRIPLERGNVNRRTATVASKLIACLLDTRFHKKEDFSDYPNKEEFRIALEELMDQLSHRPIGSTDTEYHLLSWNAVELD